MGFKPCVFSGVLQQNYFILMILRKDLVFDGQLSSTCNIISIRVDSGLGVVESIYYYVLVEIVIME